MIDKDIIQQYILRAISCFDSDDLERAEAAFRHCTPEQMKQEHGQSGSTRQEILDGYRKQRVLNEEAKQYFESLIAKDK